MNFKEIAKFLAGLITGDFLVGLWWVRSGELPINFLGLRLNQLTVSYWMLIDAVLIVFLGYFAWFNKSKKHK